MNKTITWFAALALAGAAGVASAEAATDSGTEDLEGLTCQKLLDVDAEMIPRYVYWLDGHTQGGEGVYQVRSKWMAAPVANVVTECERDPSRMASEVVREQRQSHDQ